MMTNESLKSDIPVSVAAISNKFGFKYLENVDEITSILKNRLPKSGNIYNMSLVYDKFKNSNEMAFYVMCMNNDKTPTDTNSWILASFCRVDYGMRYALSAPKNVVITPEIKTTFVECPYINWNENYHFASICSEISPMIWEISTKVFGNYVATMPCKIFTMSLEEAEKLDVDVTFRNEDNFVLQQMNPESGADFISKTWKYSVPQKTTEAMQKLLKKTPSSGLYNQNGEIVCGMCNNDCGLMGMLHTMPKYRGKGFATLVAKHLMKSLADEVGAIPYSAVEIRNTKSMAFHEKLGMTVSHYVDFIKHTSQTWD